MSHGTDGSKEQSDSTLTQLKQLLDELNDDLKGSQKKELFKMAELLLSMNVRSEACVITNHSGKTEFGLVIPISQFKEFRRLIVSTI